MRQRHKECVIRRDNVTKKKNSEAHFHQKLQLYMPWRDEDHLKSEDQTFKEKFEEVESKITENIDHHEPFYHIEVEDIPEPFIDQLDEDEGNEDFLMFEPSLIDFNESVRHERNAVSLQKLLFRRLKCQ